MITWIKILEFSSELGYLKQRLLISGLTLLVIAVLSLLRKKISTKLSPNGRADQLLQAQLAQYPSIIFYYSRVHLQKYL